MIINGTRLFGPFLRKISGSYGTSYKVVLFFRTESSNGSISSSHLISLIPVLDLSGHCFGTLHVNRTDLCKSGGYLLLTGACAFPVKKPEVFEKVHSAQFPSPFLSGEFTLTMRQPVCPCKLNGKRVLVPIFLVTLLPREI